MKRINTDGIVDCPKLFSSHEEADTLCADQQFHAKGYNGRIVVKSPDTDVLVLLVHYFPQMCNTCELWFQTGSISTTKDGRRYIPVHEICNCLSSVICNVLPAAHAITGCDTTAFFFGHR